MKINKLTIMHYDMILSKFLFHFNNFIFLFHFNNFYYKNSYNIFLKTFDTSFIFKTIEIFNVLLILF